MALHYKGKVYEWEIWNEPDINKEQIKDYKSLTDLNIRTAEIIKRIEPDAKIAALALAFADAEFLEKCMQDFMQILHVNIDDFLDIT